MIINMLDKMKTFLSNKVISNILSVAKEKFIETMKFGFLYLEAPAEDKNILKLSLLQFFFVY